MHDSKCERVWGGAGFGWSPCYCNSRPAEHAIEADIARVRLELTDRLARCTDHDQGLAFGWLCDNHADLVNEALDETGATS